MKVRCKFCDFFEKGFCVHKKKLRAGKSISVNPNKRRDCNYFDINVEEADRELNKKPPRAVLRPETAVMDRGDKSRLRRANKEKEEVFKRNYLGQFKSTATDSVKEIKESSTEEGLF